MKWGMAVIIGLTIALATPFAERWVGARLIDWAAAGCNAADGFYLTVRTPAGLETSGCASRAVFARLAWRP